MLVPCLLALRSFSSGAMSAPTLLPLPARVIDGWETLDDLEKVPVHEKSFRPLSNIYLRRVTIHANPLAQ